MPPISCITVNSSVSGSLFSIAYTVGSLLWAAIARIKGSVTDRFSVSEFPPLLQEIPMSRSRIPIDQAMADRRFYRRRSTNKSTYSVATVPQRLFNDSIPVIHDSFPDPILWNRIEENLILQEEKVFRKNPNLSKTNLKRTMPITSKQNVRTISHSSSKQYFSKSRSRHKRSVRIFQNLEGVFRRRQLYCQTGYHLQVLPNGRVAGTAKDHDKYAILDFISVGIGLVTIRGVDSGKYLSMDHRGRLYGSDVRTKNSVFQETLQENWYNTYSATRTRRHVKKCFITINKNGKWRPGCRSTSNQRITHFLPRPVDPKKVPELYKGILY